MAIVTLGVEPASRLLSAPPPNWLAQWADFAARTEYRDLPDEVVTRTRLVLLDSVGAIIAGMAEPELRAAVKRLPQVFGASIGSSPLAQAFIGGTAGTMLEIDEGNQFARGHPGIHVIPAIIALGSNAEIDGRTALLATALGYEIGARIGIASKLRVSMHPHGTWGTVGAALAVAKLDNASAGDITTAINLASSLGLTTSRRTMLEGATVRNTYAGFSNMLGIMAWQLTASGFTGETDGVGAVYGDVAAQNWQPCDMTCELGSRWEIARNYFKRHAACRYTHAALDALSEIRSRSGGTITASEIESIQVDTYVWAAQLDNQAPTNQLAAKFSLPFTIATAIVNGRASLDAFRAEARSDAATRALAAKVTVDEDPAFTALLPAARPARLRIRLKSGAVHEATASINKGDTENPYTADEIIEKFREVTEPVIGAGRAQTLKQQLLQIETLGSLRSIAELMEVQ